MFQSFPYQVDDDGTESRRAVRSYQIIISERRKKEITFSESLIKTFDHHKLKLAISLLIIIISIRQHPHTV